MKLRLLIAFTVILFSNRLFSQYQEYHSIADIESGSTATQSILELILWPDNNKEAFGILVGQDKHSYTDKMNSYVLFSPASGLIAPTDIDDLSLEYAAPMKTEELKYLIGELEKLIQKWGSEKSDLKGSFFEFMTAPDYRIWKISDSAVEWQPTIKFGFQDFPGETIGVLYIGPKQFAYKYEFDDLDELKTFYDMLVKAENKITMMK